MMFAQKRIRIHFSVYEEEASGIAFKHIDRMQDVMDEGTIIPRFAIRNALMRIFDDIHAEYVEWVFNHYFKEDPNKDRPFPTSEVEMRAEIERACAAAESEASDA